MSISIQGIPIWQADYGSSSPAPSNPTTGDIHISPSGVDIYDGNSWHTSPPLNFNEVEQNTIKIENPWEPGNTVYCIMTSEAVTQLTIGRPYIIAKCKDSASFTYEQRAEQVYILNDRGVFQYYNRKFFSFTKPETIGDETFLDELEHV